MVLDTVYIWDTVCVYIYMYMTEGGGVCVKLMIKGLCMTIKKIISTTSSQQGRGKNEPPPPLQNPIVQFERLFVCDGNSWTPDDLEWKKTFFKYGLYVSLWYDSSLPRVISCVYAKFGWNPLSGTWEGGGYMYAWIISGQVQLRPWIWQAIHMITRKPQK